MKMTCPTRLKSWTSQSLSLRRICLFSLHIDNQISHATKSNYQMKIYAF